MVSRLDQIYYRQELEYLRNQGKIFSDRNPEIARYLGVAGTDPSLRDPHAERIVEAFAFLMGRFTRFREAQYPLFVQSLFQMIHPQYLRAQPSKTLVEFTAKESMIDQPTLVKRGTELYADNMGPDGQRYTFTTCWDVWVQPLILEKVYYDPEAPGDYGISLVLRAHDGADLAGCDWDQVEFTICGEPTTRAEWYLLLADCPGKHGVSIKGWKGSNESLKLDLSGFKEDHDYSEAARHRPTRLNYPRDYFDDPRRFQCFRIEGLADLMKGKKDLRRIQIDIGFNRPFPPGVDIKTEHIKLHCVVAQNLFEEDCRVLVDGDKLEYALSPDFTREDLEVRDIVRVIASKDRDMHEVRPYYSFNRAQKDAERQWFFAVRRDTAIENGWDTFLRLIDLEHQGPGALDGYTLSIRTACTNRRNAERLKIGHLNKVSTDVPEMIEVTNISLATRSAWPPLHSREEWDFLAHLALDYSELESPDGSPDVIKNLLTLYCTARDDAGLRRIRGILEVRGEEDYIIKQGACLPGRKLVLTVDVNYFNGLGDMTLFGRVFSHFLQAYCPINGFIKLVIVDRQSKTSFEYVAWG
ncbi:MAG: type VI secretion system baseplate subunit TssF [Acidobacteriota bacterium]|nr:type VI secretion system baseplate subunit TssF [Acidobacteriota bacterium]